jgi:polysaccharide export outer membrane protein
LNGDFRVDFDGNLELPYDVTINTNNPSLSELKKKLLELYQPYFKGVPDINIRVKQHAYWVDVRGLVQKPGRYLLQQGDSLDEVLAQAGGIIKENPPKFVRIQKGQETFAMDLNQYYGQGEDQILGWLGGEVIFFQQDAGSFADSSITRRPLTIVGEVRKPGDYVLKPGQDIVDVISQADGFTNEADLDRIELIRRTGGRKRVFDFSWREFQRTPAPAPGDVVFVHADKQSKIDRRIAIIAVFLTAVTAAALVYDVAHNHQ